MKINGKKLDKINQDVLVIPRPEGDVVFIAQGVLSYKEFETICPIPEAPMVSPAENKGAPYRDLKDPKFVALYNQHFQRKNDWFVIESLKASKDLEWETVDSRDPDTWGNWKKELEEAFFTENEIFKIYQLCLSVNSMDDGMLQAARDRFIAGTTAKQPQAQ